MAGAITGWIYRTGLRKGTTGRHWSWLVVALAARIIRGEVAREERAVISMSVNPGDRLVVSASKPEPKR